MPSTPVAVLDGCGREIRLTRSKLLKLLRE